jgi:hypothetical protein
MTLTHTTKPLSPNGIAAGALAALGAASAIPIPLAQLDFAGFFNVFNIDSGDSSRALLVIAAVGGVLTTAVVALALTGAVLAFTGARSARTILIAAALAGLVTAIPLWTPAGVVIGAAALILGDTSESEHGVERSRRNPRAATGVTTRTPRQGET